MFFLLFTSVFLIFDQCNSYFSPVYFLFLTNVFLTFDQCISYFLPVYCRLPLFENPTVYEYEEDKVYDPAGQSYNDEKPLGYTRFTLPHPPNNARPNPVFELRDLEDRQIEMRVCIFCNK